MPFAAANIFAAANVSVSKARRDSGLKGGRVVAETCYQKLAGNLADYPVPYKNQLSFCKVYLSNCILKLKCKQKPFCPSMETT